MADCLSRFFTKECETYDSETKSLYFLLCCAVYSQNIQECKRLLKRGAKAYLPNYAAEPTTFQKFLYNLSTLSPSAVSYVKWHIKNGDTPLHFASGGAKVAVCKLLLDNGANVNARGINDSTPFFNAISGGRFEVCDLLVEYSVDVKTLRLDGGNYLHYFSTFGFRATLEWLLKKGLDVNEKNKKGDTPLHLASLNGNRCNCATLLKYGADINCTDGQGQTPLHHAVTYYKYNTNRKQLCIMLLKNGANPSLKDNRGRSSIDIAPSSYIKQYLKSYTT